MGGWLSSSEAEPRYESRDDPESSYNYEPRKGEPWRLSLSPKQLGSWYKDNIQSGTTLFDDDCCKAVDKVVRWMHHECDVSEIIKGGSLGKGTMVKDLSDVDLVAFINPPHLRSIGFLTPEHYRSKLQDVIKDLKTTVSRLPDVTIIKSDAYLVNFELNVGSRCIQVDLLPTADNVHGRNLDEVFEEMLLLKRWDMGFYSASLVKLQREFFGNQPGYVKELIRLVKYWAYTNLPDHLQKSYPLELITIYRWEKAGEPYGRQMMLQGVKDVLEVLTDLSSLQHYWIKNYDTNMAERSIRQLHPTRPIMLDPANPTNNVCWPYQRGDNMEVMADAAQATLDSRLLRDVIVYHNWSG